MIFMQSVFFSKETFPLAKAGPCEVQYFKLSHFWGSLPTNRGAYRFVGAPCQRRTFPQAIRQHNDACSTPVNEPLRMSCRVLRPSGSFSSLNQQRDSAVGGTLRSLVGACKHEPALTSTSSPFATQSASSGPAHGLRSLRRLKLLALPNRHLHERRMFARGDSLIAIQSRAVSEVP